jgi:four helix bundle protein
MKESIIRTKSFDFAVETIFLCKNLINQKEFILSKQLLRSSTSIGANIRESRNAESKKDFIHKLSISLKECDETIYWLELMHKTQYIGTDQFNSLNSQALELLRMLKSSIITMKKNL